MSGRFGNTVTLNGRTSEAEPFRSGERVRLRLVNASLARIMALGFAGHRPVVVALDGQPCDPHVPDGGRIFLGPAMRVDLMLDMPGEPGRRYDVIDDFYDGLSYRLTQLVYDGGVRSASIPSTLRLRCPATLCPNPISPRGSATG